VTGREGTGYVPDAGDEIDADLFGQLDVGGRVRRGVDERRPTRPVLVGGVDVEDLGDDAFRTGAIEQPFVFDGNDVPGVMLSGGARRLSAACE